MFKCTPVNGKKKKKKGFADCSHVWYVNLYFLFIWARLEVLAGGLGVGVGVGVGGVVVTESFQTVLNRNRIMDETEAHDTNTQLYNFPYFIQFD